MLGLMVQFIGYFFVYISLSKMISFFPNQAYATEIFREEYQALGLSIVSTVSLCLSRVHKSVEHQH